MHTLKNIHKEYTKEVDSSVDSSLFRQLCEEFNMLVVESLLEGEEFNMGSNLSTLSIRRLQRNPKRPTIDWYESNKFKSELLSEDKELYNNETGEGHKWFIYYTDPWYYKYHWEKHRCKIPNKTAYRFTPTRGIKGNKEKLTKLLKEDELAYLRFKTHGNL